MWIAVHVSVPPDPWSSDTYTDAPADSCTPVDTAVDTAMDLVANGGIAVRGNHDNAIGEPSDSMNADAQAAIDWLQRAFGFHAQAVYADGDTVFHAQLTFGTGMIMLGSADKESEWSQHAAMPDEVGGRQTQNACVIVTDADAHYARAKAAGARIVIDIADQDYGGRGYACADPEGYLWWFGSYDPWRSDHGQ